MLERLRRRKEALEADKRRRALLPHLYGRKWYKWAWEFFTSRNRSNWLCAANQISKSSTMIRKAIHWATAVAMWPSLWPTAPTQFWYFYPSHGVGAVEFNEKWVKEFLPRGEMKEDPIFGWKEEWKIRNKELDCIRFNSGVTIYFKSYEQKFDNLQTSSVYAMFADEECPEHLYHELRIRMIAPDVRGYWHSAFTATIGQEYLRLTIEERGTKHELFPDAAKWQVSMYDCMLYRDGSPSSFTKEYIEKEVIPTMKSEAEVQRRVWGRFVLDSNRMYTGFTRSKNWVKAHKLPKSWLIFAGIDDGTGGKAHPPAISFIAVKPDFTAGRVFKVWRGDDGSDYDAGDVIDKYVELKGKLKVVACYYDHQAKSLSTVASRRKPAIPLMKADKSRDSGIGLFNTLLRMGILKIYDEGDNIKLVHEMEALKSTTPKPQAKDDAIDATRFAVVAVPWDLMLVKKNAKPSSEEDQLSDRERRHRRPKVEVDVDKTDFVEEEIDEWNEAYEFGLDVDIEYEVEH